MTESWMQLMSGWASRMRFSSRSTLCATSMLERLPRNCTSRLSRISLGPKCTVSGRPARSTLGSLSASRRILATVARSALSPNRVNSFGEHRRTTAEDCDNKFCHRRAAITISEARPRVMLVKRWRNVHWVASRKSFTRIGRQPPTLAG